MIKFYTYIDSNLIKVQYVGGKTRIIIKTSVKQKVNRLCCWDVKKCLNKPEGNHADCGQ